METYITGVMYSGGGGIFNGITEFGISLIVMPLSIEYVDLVYAAPACTPISLNMNA